MKNVNFINGQGIEGISRVKKNTEEKSPAKIRIHDTYTEEISRIKTVANPLKALRLISANCNDIY